MNGMTTPTHDKVTPLYWDGIRLQNVDKKHKHTLHQVPSTMAFKTANNSKLKNSTM